MYFNSYEFLCAFLPIMIAGFAVLRQLHRGSAVAWLVLGSLVFYGWWEPPYLLLLVASIVVNFICGRWQQHYRKGTDGRGSRLLMGCAIAINLAALAWFKYAGFLGISGGFDILLPLAISFFTFQQIAYQVDTYFGLAEPHSFLDYCFFVSFFPQLVAGPIVHHRTILPQVRDPVGFRIDAEGVAVGLSFLVFGLAKKVLIADNLAPWVQVVFAAALNGEPVGAAAAWGAALAFTVQIYFDFSGYSDMAVGLGRLFGIRLPRNFNSPLRATSIIDFWNRWHITLSTFLRDYLFFPLAGKRNTLWRRHLALFLTMVLGGLWHGAAWTFVIWGALHGVFLAINHLWRSWHGRVPGLPPLVAWALTFTAFVVSLVFFRAESLDSAISLVQTMVGFGEGVAKSPFPSHVWGHVVVTLALALLVPNLHQWFSAWKPTSDRPLAACAIRWAPVWWWWLPTALLGLYCLTQLDNISEFLYYNF